MYACNRWPTAVIVDQRSLRPADTVGDDGLGRDRAKRWSMIRSAADLVE
ncbi:hypothetical protein ACFYR1_27865 [Streptomyces canus]